MREWESNDALCETQSSFDVQRKWPMMKDSAIFLLTFCGNVFICIIFKVSLFFCCTKTVQLSGTVSYLL